IHLGPGFRANAVGATVPTTFHAWVETAPSAVSVSPTSGSALSQQFTWTASSPSGYTNISELQALISQAWYATQNSCYIRYNRASNLLYLADDSGSPWLGGFAPGTSGTASNRQCSISGIGSSVLSSGNQLSLTVAVTFLATFGLDDLGQL